MRYGPLNKKWAWITHLAVGHKSHFGGGFVQFRAIAPPNVCARPCPQVMCRSWAGCSKGKYCSLLEIIIVIKTVLIGKWLVYRKGFLCFQSRQLKDGIFPVFKASLIKKQITFKVISTKPIFKRSLPKGKILKNNDLDLWALTSNCPSALVLLAFNQPTRLLGNKLGLCILEC